MKLDQSEPYRRATELFACKSGPDQTEIYAWVRMTYDIIKSQREQIAALTERLAALESTRRGV